MSLRETGKNALGKVLSNSKNCDTIEKQVWKISDKDEDAYIDNLYQTSGLLLKNKKDLKGVFGLLKDNKMGWDAPVFDNIRNRIKEHDEFLEKPFEVSKGVVKCKCGSESVYSIPVQNRSCDEATSTRCRCAECGKNWVQNNS